VGLLKNIKAVDYQALKFSFHTLSFIPANLRIIFEGIIQIMVLICLIDKTGIVGNPSCTFKTSLIILFIQRANAYRFGTG
jgi:hypothetical protein